MAQIVINIDTANKKDSYVEIDGKKLKNVDGVVVYGMGNEYMGIEISQYERIGEDEGAMVKFTKTVASEQNNFTPSVEHKASDDLVTLLNALLGRG